MRVRQLQEEKAAAELAHAHRVRSDAAATRHAIEGKLATQSFPMEGPVDVMAEAHRHTYDATTWRAVAAARASTTEMLRESTQALALANQGVDAATAHWADAKMRAAMIDKLKARHDRAVEADELREEQVALDETALRRSLEVRS